MRIIFCGGGTVGHITPAIAIAEGLLKLNDKTEILFIGRKDGPENRIIEKNGFDLKTVKINGLERKISISNIKNCLTALQSLKSAKKIIKEFAPDAVVGTGGYVTWPVIRAAQKLKIPTLIHESNACPGLVTRLLAPKSTRVLLNLQGSEKEFKNQNNIKIVGNPVRHEFVYLSRNDARKKLGVKENEILISSFGGSGGSEIINKAVIGLMNCHCLKNKNIKHIHSCGNKYYTDIKNKYPNLTSGQNGCIIKSYIDDMPTLMVASDIIISRCGAMTLAELSASGVAGILIPSPNVTNNHQYKNARLIADAGAGILIEEIDLTESSLLETVKLLETDLRMRKNISEKIKSFYVYNSTEEIINEIKKLI
jgi:UDP-N-acetylglucosamine--N-acetylmuramyl-(pentapeptide) pyrophosphoryl-undecaprenol N-acetylglucosamine transferase